MADLRQSLHALVDHPPAQPVDVDVVAARASRITGRRQRRSAMALAVGAIALAAGIGVGQQTPEPDVTVAMDGSDAAGYIAEQPGGYVASGTWFLTIKRGDLVIRLSSSSNHFCGPLGTIQAGDEVSGSIVGPASALRVGEKFSCPG